MQIPIAYDKNAIIRFTYDGSYLICSVAGNVSVFNLLLNTLKHVSVSKVTIDDMAISVDSSILAVCMSGGIVELYSLEDIITSNDGSINVLKSYKVKSAALSRVLFTYRNLLLCGGRLSIAYK